MFKHHPLFSLENTYRAYCQCRKHKRGTVNAMRFEQNLEENLVSLHEELTAGSYRPGRSIAFLIDPPRPALRIAQQRAQLCHRLPGHVLVVQMGRWWELWGSYPEDLLSEEWQRFPDSRLPTVRDILWQSGLPVAWIGETGRRVTGISERVLACRWPGVSDQRPLSMYRPNEL